MYCKALILLDLEKAGDFDLAINQLSNFIKSQAEEIGLRLESKIELDNKEDVNSLKFDSMNMPIVACDYSKELNLKVTAEIGVEKPKLKDFQSGSAEAIEKLFRQKLRGIAASKLYLQDYYYNSSEYLVEFFRPDLKSELKKEGRVLERFFCERSDQPPISNAIQEVETVITHVLGAERNNKNKVTINFRGNMQIKDAARYKLADSIELNKWFSSQLKNIVQDVLFKKDISELFAFREKNENGKSLEEIIESKICDKAESIGFELTALISEPHFDGIELIKPFDLCVENEFPICEYEERVRLRVDITTRINKKDLQDIMFESKEAKSIKEDLRVKIEDTIRRFLQKIYPEDYYMNYDFSSDGSLGVEGRLREEIKETILDFPAEIISIVPKRLGDDVTAKVHALTYHSMTRINFEVQPNDFKEKINFLGDFRVDNVNPKGWHIFRRSDPSLEDIKSHLSLILSSSLSNFSTADLVDRTVEGWKDLLSALNNHMRSATANAFGLDVSLLTISIGETEEEKRIRNIEEKKNDLISGQRLYSLEEEIKLIDASRASNSENIDHDFKLLTEIDKELRKIATDPDVDDGDQNKLLAEKSKILEKYSGKKFSLGEIDEQLSQAKKNLMNSRFSKRDFKGLTIEGEEKNRSKFEELDKLQKPQEQTDDRE